VHDESMLAADATVKPTVATAPARSKFLVQLRPHENPFEQQLGATSAKYNQQNEGKFEAGKMANGIRSPPTAA